MDEPTYTWDAWCERFRTRLKELEYSGPLMMSSFYDDWQQDTDPRAVAEAFVNEMHS